MCVNYASDKGYKKEYYDFQLFYIDVFSEIVLTLFWTNGIFLLLLTTHVALTPLKFILEVLSLIFI